MRLGIAFGSSELRAVRLGGGGVPTPGVSPWTASLEQVSAQTLRNALERLRAEWEIDDAVLDVSILPPLVQIRRIELPRLRTDEVRRVLERNADRYFFGVREPQAVDVRVLKRGARSRVPVLATAVSTHVLDSLFAATNDLGWQIGTVSSAYEAWALGLSPAIPKGEGSVGWVLLCSADGYEGIQVERGRPILARRGPRSLGAAAVSRWLEPSDTEATNAGPVRVSILGTPENRSALDEELEHGALGQAVLGNVEHDDAVTLAAAYAGRVPQTELAPQPVRAARRERARRRVRTLLSAATALIVVAGVLESWGASRELEAVRLQRAALADRVEAVMEERTVLIGLSERLRALSDLEDAAPRWSYVLAGVTAHLPSDAHLVGFEARADTLVLEGLANRAAGVFEALRSAPDILAVRAQAPVRRELLGEGDPVERFTLSASLASPAERGGGR